MTIEIGFSDLWTTSEEDYTLRVALYEVKDWEWHHIHGTLLIAVNGRPLPDLGYFGPDDACFDTWVAVLTTLVETLSTSSDSEYTWDQGEQGQPAFRWVRRGDEVRISIKQSQISDGRAHPEWQGVPCRFDDLLQQVHCFLAALRREIERQNPELAAAWWRRAISTTP